jgi:carbamoyltransferase
LSRILGINAYHSDASACLIRDGKIVAAAEEERFRRVKHWAGFPSEAIRYCLSEAGLEMSDVGHIAINQDRKANLVRKFGYALAKKPSLKFLFDRVRHQRKRAGLEQDLERNFPGQKFAGRVHQIEHHLAHLGSAYLVSRFPEAAVVSVDAFGDFASAAWGVGSRDEIDIAGKVYFPHSLGIFYEALTQYLGFMRYGDEYKVMGLAPYGEPRYLDQMRRTVKLLDDGTYRLDLQYFRHASGELYYEWDQGEPVVQQLFTPALEELLGPPRKADEPLTQRHRDIARSVQAMYEEAFFHLLNMVHAKYGLDSLALAGGCAMNSVANGKIYRNTPFKRLYIQSAAGDAGGAIGAAFLAWQQIKGGNVQVGARTRPPSNEKDANSSITAPTGRFVMDHAYWGPQFSDDQIHAEILAHGAEIETQGCTVRRVDDEEELCRLTTVALADGLVVGWFQGRMEWGPRALGNRSILCDPRRADMKDILNLKIKRRESFRPFAPSILREAVPDWFEIDDDVPFMMQVYPIRAEKRSVIPAVTHVDGSGRLQTVDRATNPRYYRLIETFKKLTGVPIVLNTSFNENEPVVCQPKEALDCFLRTKMDFLVMGNWVIERRTAA